MALDTGFFIPFLWSEMCAINALFQQKIRFQALALKLTCIDEILKFIEKSIHLFRFIN